MTPHDKGPLEFAPESQEPAPVETRDEEVEVSKEVSRAALAAGETLVDEGLESGQATPGEDWAPRRTVSLSSKSSKSSVSRAQIDKKVQEPEPLPERVGGYRILRRVGRGGMGTVFEARDDRGQLTARHLTVDGATYVVA